MTEKVGLRSNCTAIANLQKWGDVGIAPYMVYAFTQRKLWADRVVCPYKNAVKSRTRADNVVRPTGWYISLNHP